MIKRAWFVFAIGWAGMVMLNGFSRVNGPTKIDVFLALAPLIVARIARFIVFGPRSKAIPYRPR